MAHFPPQISRYMHRDSCGLWIVPASAPGVEPASAPVDPSSAVPAPAPAPAPASASAPAVPPPPAPGTPMDVGAIDEEEEEVEDASKRTSGTKRWKGKGKGKGRARTTMTTTTTASSSSSSRSPHTTLQVQHLHTWLDSGPSHYIVSLMSIFYLHVQERCLHHAWYEKRVITYSLSLWKFVSETFHVLVSPLASRGFKAARRLSTRSVLTGRVSFSGRCILPCVITVIFSIYISIPNRIILPPQTKSVRWSPPLGRVFRRSYKALRIFYWCFLAIKSTRFCSPSKPAQFHLYQRSSGNNTHLVARYGSLKMCVNLVLWYIIVSWTHLLSVSILGKIPGARNVSARSPLMTTHPYTTRSISLPIIISLSRLSGVPIVSTHPHHTVRRCCLSELSVLSYRTSFFFFSFSGCVSGPLNGTARCCLSELSVLPLFFFFVFRV